MAERAPRPALQIDGLEVYYGQSHALQGVSLTVERGILAVVGRNGMGKTTLCNTVVGLLPARAGSIRLDGRPLLGLAPHAITRLGVGFVPQGRRLWPSLTVDETLRLAVRGRGEHRGWTPERVYTTFPRLALRRTNGGGQLSGGEQQMLAIARALLGNPRLLVMDEPTEGLAPAIVEQVSRLLVELATEEGIDVLLVEQNLGVATTVAGRVAIMVNGRIGRVMDASALAADRNLQQRLLGVGLHGEEGITEDEVATTEAITPLVLRVERHGQDGDRPSAPASYGTVRELPNRWGVRALPPLDDATPAEPAEVAKAVFTIPFIERIGRTALVVGTFDTKGPELRFMRDRLRALGVPVRTVDLSVSGKPSSADVPPAQVAASHPVGASSVLDGDRGQRVAAMADAFARWIEGERGIGGILSAGGSGGTALATAGMRKLPVGIPKIMVSSVASGEVGRYVGPADIMMLHSVADVQGLNPITEQVLGNAANALAGMIAGLPSVEERDARRRHARPAVGLTMFGVTTPAVQSVVRGLEGRYDCLVFHATGTGGRSMEHLGQSGLLQAFVDLTTTEVADLLVGGVFAADQDRFGAAIRTGLPVIGSVGALDMVNFGPRDTVPERFRSRRLVMHNPNVTLMRTTRDESRAIGTWIGERLNRMEGPVRFLLPEGGVSMLDAPGQAFHDPEADAALFEALERTVKVNGRRRLQRVPANINDPSFAAAVLGAFAEVEPRQDRRA